MDRQCAQNSKEELELDLEMVVEMILTTNSWLHKYLSVDFCPLGLGDRQCAQNSKAELKSILGGRNDTQLMMKSQTY